MHGWKRLQLFVCHTKEKWFRDIVKHCCYLSYFIVISRKIERNESCLCYDGQIIGELNRIKRDLFTRCVIKINGIKKYCFLMNERRFIILKIKKNLLWQQKSMIFHTQTTPKNIIKSKMTIKGTYQQEESSAGKVDVHWQ